MKRSDGVRLGAFRRARWCKWVSALGAAAVWLSLHAVVHAQPSPAATSQGVAKPRSLHVVRRDRNAALRWGLIGGGAGLLAISYALPCAGARGRWCVPIAGPFLVIAHLDKQERQNHSSGDGIIPPAFVYTLISGVGVLQIFGTAAVVVGALLPRREVETSARSFGVVPLLGPSLAGLGAAGTF